MEFNGINDSGKTRTKRQQQDGGLEFLAIDSQETGFGPFRANGLRNCAHLQVVELGADAKAVGHALVEGESRPRDQNVLSGIGQHGDAQVQRRRTAAAQDDVLRGDDSFIHSFVRSLVLGGVPWPRRWRPERTRNRPRPDAPRRNLRRCAKNG